LGRLVDLLQGFCSTLRPKAVPTVNPLLLLLNGDHKIVDGDHFGDITSLQMFVEQFGKRGIFPGKLLYIIASGNQVDIFAAVAKNLCRASFGFYDMRGRKVDVRHIVVELHVFVEKQPYNRSQYDR
jgi:hypothetical protein